MTTKERQEVRAKFLALGFRRLAKDLECEFDHDRSGAYTEHWKHADGSEITLKWTAKTKGPQTAYHYARCKNLF